MNRTFSFLRVMIIALVGLGFTSCDEDIVTGSGLRGLWQGEMYVSGEYGGATYLSSYTQIEFLGEGTNVTRGTGYWMDRYSRAPWDYFYSPFTYHVRDGVITITLLYDGEVYTISDYSLYGSSFVGYLNESDERFELTKVSDQGDWGGYQPGWYSPYDDYYARPESDFGSRSKKSVPTPVRRVWNKAAYERMEE